MATWGDQTCQRFEATAVGFDHSMVDDQKKLSASADKILNSSVKFLVLLHYLAGLYNYVPNS